MWILTGAGVANGECCVCCAGRGPPVNGRAGRWTSAAAPGAGGGGFLASGRARRGLLHGTGLALGGTGRLPDGLGRYFHGLLNRGDVLADHLLRRGLAGCDLARCLLDRLLRGRLPGGRLLRYFLCRLLRGGLLGRRLLGYFPGGLLGGLLLAGALALE